MLNAVLFVAIGVWLGAMIFFAAVVAPTVFGTLEPQLAGQIIRRVFPRYYLFGLVCLSVATLASLYASVTTPWVTVACTVMLGVTWYARQVLLPQVNEAREVMFARNEMHSSEFDRLHKRSVQLNTTAMVVCLVLLFTLVS